MILLIDNYDSFTYNLYQQIGAFEPDIKVVRNDFISLVEIEMMQPTHIVISPGPKRPSEAGMSEQIVKAFSGKIPILGICLGHQAICEANGAKIVLAKELMHGKQSIITVDLQSKMFSNMNAQIKAGRYHSLIVQEETLPDYLQVTARAQNGEVMAVEDKKNKVYGLQFHPESILTENGNQLIENFLMEGK